MGEEKQVVGPAIALRSSGTVLGLTFNSVPTSTFGWTGTRPIEGKVYLDYIYLKGRAYAPYTNLFRLLLSVATDLPTCEADVAKADPVLPAASTLEGAEDQLMWALTANTVPIPVGKVVTLNGRRFVGLFRNNGGTTATFQVEMGVHRVIGGVARAHDDLLWGEEMEWR